MICVMKYSEIQPYETGFLNRDSHQLYYEISGREDGVPIVFLHGGPGSGTNPWQRQLFNPEKYKIIFLDQRGCGKSKPHGSLYNNTTAHLVDDLHALKEHLNVDKWHVFGGSWGSTLALAYADEYVDEDFLSITIYGIFLCRPLELVNMYEKGGVSSTVFADRFEEYISVLPIGDQVNAIHGYNKIFKGTDEVLKKRALTEWTKWELQISRLEVAPESLNVQMNNFDYVLSHSLIENHYFMKNGFVDGDELLKRIGEKVSNVPVNIIQGRYDMVCPFKTAFELHKAIPHSVFTVIPNAGHTVKEPETLKKVTEILDLL